jgi:hypothetical protein
MQDMYREQLWRKRGRPRELYPDMSSKDAPVPPDLPIPNCDCGFTAHVFQLTSKQAQLRVASTHAVVLMW